MNLQMIIHYDICINGEIISDSQQLVELKNIHHHQCLILDGFEKFHHDLQVIPLLLHGHGMHDLQQKIICGEDEQILVLKIELEHLLIKNDLVLLNIIYQVQLIGRIFMVHGK